MKLLKTSKKSLLLHCDSSNVEQLVLCFRWVDADLYILEDFAAIHTIKKIKSDTIVVVVKDVIARFNIPLANCCGKFYHGASNMTGHKKRVA